MKTPTRTIALITCVVLALIGFILWRDIRFANDLDTINRILRRNDAFKTLKVAPMKPGFTKVYGTLRNSNELDLLKNELRTKGIHNCALIIELDNKPEPQPSQK